MTVGQRIREARKLRQMTRQDLIARTGMKYPTLAGIENGDQRDSTQLPQIADALSVNVLWLQTGRGTRDALSADPDWEDVIRYRQGAAAGDGACPDEYAETDRLKFKATSLQKKGLHARKLAIFYARGDSMEGRIHTGDALLFDQDDTAPRDGKIFVVKYEGDYLVKRLAQYGQQWFLTSDNTADPKWKKPVPVTIGDTCEIVGRVRWIGSWED